MKLLGIGPWFLVHGALERIIVLFQQEATFESSNHSQSNPIQGPCVKDNPMFDHGPLTMSG